MKRLASATLALVLIAVCSSSGTEHLAWAQAFGIISGTVEKADGARGLSVRTEPSKSAPVIGYLPVGTEIKSCNDFREGWVRLESPSRGKWVNMASIRPKGGEATVTDVDKPELCLTIRKGPYSSYEKVGCAELGQKLRLSGVWSTTNWARLDDGGWVDAAKIETDLFVCSAPLAESPSREPQMTVEQPVMPPAQPPDIVATIPVPVPPLLPSLECPSFGFSWDPLWLGNIGGPVFYGDFGAFGFFPGFTPFVSIGGGPYGRYYRSHGRPYFRHHGRHPSAYWPRHRGFPPRSRPVMHNRWGHMTPRGANAFRSYGGTRSFSRPSYSSGFRSPTTSGFRGSSFGRGRAMHSGTFSGSHFRGGGSMRGGGPRMGGFRGSGAHGGGFRGAGSHGGGGRR